MAAKETGLFRPHAHPFLYQRCSLEGCQCAGQVSPRTWGPPSDEAGGAGCWEPTGPPRNSKWTVVGHQHTPPLLPLTTHISLCSLSSSPQLAFSSRRWPTALLRREGGEGPGRRKKKKGKKALGEELCKTFPTPHCSSWTPQSSLC